MLFVGLVVGSYFVWSNSFVLFRSSRTVLGIVLAFALLTSFYGLIVNFKAPSQVLWGTRWVDREYVRLASTYICANHFAHLLQMLLPFCLVLLFIPKAGIFLRILAGYCIAVFLPTMYFTQSRAGMLGSIVAVGVTVLLLALRKSKKLFFMLLVVVPLVSTVLLVGMWNYSEMFKRRMTPVVEFVSDLHTEGFANTTTKDFRPLTWLDTIEMIKENPATGFGPGSYRYAFPEYRKRVKAVRIVTGHPHNEYLEVASEYGLIGFGLFALAWCYGLVRLLVFSLKTSQQHHAFVAMAFLGTAAGTMLHSFFDFQMHVFQNAMVFSLLGGIAAGPICGRRQEATSGKLSVMHRMWTIVLALAVVCGLVIALIAFSSAFFRAQADRLVESGRAEVAKARYERAIRIDPSNWRAYKGLGLLYGKERYYSLDMEEKQAFGVKEQAVLRDGYSHNPKDAGLTVALGEVTCFLGDVDRGLELLHEATRLRPFNDNYWWSLGVEERKAGRYDDALETFHSAAKIKNSASIRKNIQWLEKQLKGNSISDGAEAPAYHHGTLKKSDNAVSLDELHNLMNSH